MQSKSKLWQGNKPCVRSLPYSWTRWTENPSKNLPKPLFFPMTICKKNNSFFCKFAKETVVCFAKIWLKSWKCLIFLRITKAFCKQCRLLRKVKNLEKQKTFLFFANFEKACFSKGNCYFFQAKNAARFSRTSFLTCAKIAQLILGTPVMSIMLKSMFFLKEIITFWRIANCSI